VSQQTGGKRYFKEYIYYPTESSDSLKIYRFINNFIAENQNEIQIPKVFILTFYNNQFFIETGEVKNPHLKSEYAVINNISDFEEYILPYIHENEKSQIYQ